MSRELLTLPLWIVLVLPFAKILATSLSIGSGGSGGIFGPGMVTGGMLGAAFWRLGAGHLPQLPSSSAPFVIVGMMALFGGIAHAPLAVMLMVAEMTGNLSLLAPAMIAVALATFVVGDETIYRQQLPDRASSPAHRVRFGFPLLSSLLARDAMRPVAAGIAVDTQIALSPDAPLDGALERLAETDAPSLQVTADGAVVGELSVRDIVGAYRAALGRMVRRTRDLPSDTRLLELEVAAGSMLAGRILRDAKLPPGALIVAVVRDGQSFFPRADSRIDEGDVVSILTSSAQERDLRALLSR